MNLDKKTILQIIGSIMKEPSLLSKIDKYRLVPEDFTSSFERLIFSSIYNLYSQGVEHISEIDVDTYLSAYTGPYERFKKNNGIQYLQDALEISEIDNFNYYYTKLKKYNAIRDLKKDGFDTDAIYPDNPDLDDNADEKIEKFDSMSVKEIFNNVKQKFINIESKYMTGEDLEAEDASDNIFDFIKDIDKNPDIGSTLQGDAFNTIVRGARKGKFYILSGGTGTGKTRNMVGHSCYLAYPVRYDNNKGRWVETGACEKVLYLCTEQTSFEIKSAILAYLTGLNESVITSGNHTPEVKERLEQAAMVMKKYQNLKIKQIKHPNIENIKSSVRTNVLKYDVENVFYDYIHSSPDLLSEYRDLRVREDVVLMMFSTALKDLAVELDVFMMSATQLSGDYEDKKGIKNQSFLRGAKSIADKADVGAIFTKVTDSELNLLENITKKYNIVPNEVMDIYKMRGGKYTNVRIWSDMNLGNLRKKDLFVTDASFNEVDGFNIVQFIDNNKEDCSEILNLLNDGEVANEETENFIKESLEIKQEEHSQIKEENSWEDFI